MRLFKIIATDTAGILLIIGSILFGWVPGPGGIPLFIAGLSLLSINHEWARRWLKKAQKSGLSLSKRVFNDHPGWRLAIDTISVLAFTGGVILLAYVTGNFVRGLAIGIIILAISLFLGNRERLKRLLKHFK
ncbi:MAG: PGPGW domain-containing protein [Candidatus Saccharimonadales bacterium]